MIVDGLSLVLNRQGRRSSLLPPAIVKIRTHAAGAVYAAYWSGDNERAVQIADSMLHGWSVGRGGLEVCRSAARQ